MSSVECKIDKHLCEQITKHTKQLKTKCIQYVDNINETYEECSQSLSNNLDSFNAFLDCEKTEAIEQFHSQTIPNIIKELKQQVDKVTTTMIGSTHQQIWKTTKQSTNIDKTIINLRTFVNTAKSEIQDLWHDIEDATKRAFD